MSGFALYPALEKFFQKTAVLKSENYAPEWLLSGFNEDIWVIDGGANSRLVDGVRKGAVKINWIKSLPNGKLTDMCYSKPIHQAKIILIMAFDGGVAKFNGSLKTIYGFHSFLFRIIEYLDVVHGPLFKEHGFELLNAEAVVDILQVTVEAGICGSGFFIERWEEYLSQFVDCVSDPHEVSNYLRSVNAFDSKDNLSMTFIGGAIGADASRLARSRYFREYLNKYSSLSGQSVSEAIKDKTVSQLANWFSSLAQVLASCSITNSPDFDDPHTFNELLKPFRGNASGRTKSLPFRIAKKLINGCCMWMHDIYPILDKYLAAVVDLASILRGQEGNMSSLTALKLAEKQVDIPSALEHCYSFFFKGSDPLVGNAGIAPAFVMKLLQLQIAACFVLVTLLSCSRRSEVLESCMEDCFEISDRYYFNVSLRKTGLNFQRRLMAKPIPRLVNEAVTQLRELKSRLVSYYGSTDPLVHSRIFFKVTHQGINPMLGNDIYDPLRIMSQYLGLQDSSGEPWDVMPHQLRRFFAISFYHQAGAENSLPALSWFMGHGDIEGTWRYVKESLTGKEISASEAAMAASAVCSNDASEGAERLRGILRKHFGCSNLSLMKEEDVQDYLELLSERGVYTAMPVTIRNGKNKNFAILITIKEGFDGAVSKGSDCSRGRGHL